MFYTATLTIERKFATHDQADRWLAELSFDLIAAQGQDLPMKFGVTYDPHAMDHENGKEILCQRD